MNKNIYNILITSRPTTSIITFLTVFIMLIQDNSFLLSFNGGLIFLFITAYGFIINDIMDYKKDTVAKRKRPIAQNQLSRKSAMYFSIILVSSLLIFEYLLRGYNLSFYIVLGTILLLTIYSFVSLYIPILKGFITGILCITPILYVSTIIQIDFHYAIYFIILLYIFGRELYMDAQDYAGDILSNLKTIPYYIGVIQSKYIGLAIMLLASSILLIYNLYTHNPLLFLLSISAFLVMLLSIFISFKDEDKAISLTKISMLLAIIPLFSIAT